LKTLHTCHYEVILNIFKYTDFEHWTVNREAVARHLKRDVSPDDVEDLLYWPVVNRIAEDGEDTAAVVLRMMEGRRRFVEMVRIIISINSLRKKTREGDRGTDDEDKTNEWLVFGKCIFIFIVSSTLFYSILYPVFYFILLCNIVYTCFCRINDGSGEAVMW